VLMDGKDLHAPIPSVQMAVPPRVSVLALVYVNALMATLALIVESLHVMSASMELVPFPVFALASMAGRVASVTPLSVWTIVPKEENVFALVFASVRRAGPETIVPLQLRSKLFSVPTCAATTESASPVSVSVKMDGLVAIAVSASARRIAPTMDFVRSMDSADVSVAGREIFVTFPIAHPIAVELENARFQECVSAPNRSMVTHVRRKNVRILRLDSSAITVGAAKMHPVFVRVDGRALTAANQFAQPLVLHMELARFQESALVPKASMVLHARSSGAQGTAPAMVPVMTRNKSATASLDSLARPAKPRTAPRDV